MSAVLAHHHHGKGRVRVVKVKRTPEFHHVQQYNVEILVEGEPAASSFYKGQNTFVLPTDTIKNTVYVLAKKHEFESMEEFGCIVSKYFVTRHSNIISKATVKIVEENWVRHENEDSQGKIRPHHHAFVRSGSEERFTTVVACGQAMGQPIVSVESGLRDLKILKTTQSSFVDFYRDEYTVLPDAPDRLVGTIVEATWNYNGETMINYSLQSKIVRDTLVDVFAGPADTGTPSPAVQFTLYEMGQAVLAKCPEIRDITLYMPNVHNLPYDQSKFGLHNEHPHGEIFVPVDEPHGIIQATVTRSASTQRSKL